MYWLLLLCLQISSFVCGVNGHKSFSAAVPVEEAFIPHAFIQTGEELRYFSDVAEHEIIVTNVGGKKFEYKIPPDNEVYVEPRAIDFEQTAVGVPLKHSIRITNRLKQNLFFMYIISTSLSFHCSFPDEYLLAEGATTEFTIFFLPPASGEYDNTIRIFTTNGMIPIHVKGRATDSPYRIRSISGIRIPMNATFVAPVNLHNPHPATLTITELVSSSSHVHLELPGEDLEELRDDGFWEIAPYETRTIARARIVGAEEYNSTAYISLKLRLKDSPQVADAMNFNKIDSKPPKLLIIPIDMKITQLRSIFPVNDVIDFGLIKSGEKSEQFILNVYSTVEKSIDIESIYVEKNDYTHGIYMEFVSKPPISVASGTRLAPGPSVPLAKISIDSNYVMRSYNTEDEKKPRIVRLQGRIIAESRGGNYNVSVPYRAMVYSGDLMHKPEDVAFYYRLKPPVFRSVSLTNRLPFGIAIYNITMPEEGAEVFDAQLVAPSVHLAQKEKKAVVLLKYKKQQSLSFSTHFVVHTNVTTFEVPIVMFNGEVKVRIHAVDRDVFDFGVVEPHKHRSIRFAVVNENPIPMVLKNLQQPLTPFSWLQLLGIEAGNNTKLSNIADHIKPSWKPGKDFIIPSKSSAIFKFTITANPFSTNSEPEEFVIRTEFAEYHFPVKYSIANHSVVPWPQVVDFGSIFPGMISTQNIALMSSFNESLSVDRVSLSNHDPRFFFQRVGENDEPVIAANGVSKVANLMLRPDMASSGQYVGVPLHTSDGQWFAYGMKLPANLAEIDSYLYRRLRKKYQNLVNAGRNIINTSVVVDTPRVKNLEVPVRAELVWPRLLSHSVVHFPMTAFGNFTIVNLTLSNPSAKPVIVQLLPLVIYPDADAFLDFFRDDFPAPLTDPIETNETLMFSLRDTELFTLKPSSPVPKLREQVEKVVGNSVPRFTLSMILQPKMKVRIRIGFLPSDYRLHSSLLLIRNNLTIIEPVVLYGKGAHIDMKVENKSTRSEPSMFDIQPMHLKDCFNPNRQMHRLSTTLTVKRPFEVVNTGEVPFTVTNISINGLPCENRGFHVINCAAFRLAPGERYFLEIAYTPDFLQSINEAHLQLYMHMNATPWIFNIGATIPSHMLSMCHSALPRPPFENFMYYSCIIALIFCLICVMACSYLEGDRLISYTIRQEASQELRFNEAVTNCANDQSEPAVQPASNRRRPSHYRNHVQFAQNSIFIVRWFCIAANLFLWLFSFVWMAVRSEPDVSQTAKKKNKNKKQKPVAVSPTLQTGAAAGPMYPANQQSQELLQMLEQNAKNDAAMNMELRLRNVTKTMDEDREKTASKRHRKNKSPRVKKVEKVDKLLPAPAPSEDRVKREQPVKPDSSENDKKEPLEPTNGLSVPQMEALPPDRNEKQCPLPEDDGNVSEESAPPEWADEVVDPNDFNADFADLAIASADIFSSRAGTPGSTSSQSSVPPKNFQRSPRKAVRKSESEFTTDETDASHIQPGDRSRKYKPPRGRKPKSTKDDIIDLLTQQFRENLEDYMSKQGQMASESQVSWPLSMVGGQPAMMDAYTMQQMYMQNWQNMTNYQTHMQSQLQGFYGPSRMYDHMYEPPALATLYEHGGSRVSPPDFSSDSASPNSGEGYNSFQNSQSQLGPIGSSSKTSGGKRKEHGASTYRTVSPSPLPALGGLGPELHAIVPGSHPPPPPEPAPGPSTAPTRAPTSSYGLFSNNPIWQPLLEGEDVDDHDWSKGWPDLNNYKMD